MLDETKAIKAKDVVDDPQAVYSLTRSHILLRDMSMGATFSHLMDAVEILVDAGWEMVNFTYDGGYMFAMMRNPNYKRKIL